MAGGQGLEPWLTGPEPAVLPLDDPPATSEYFAGFLKNVKLKGFIDPKKDRIKKTSIPAILPEFMFFRSQAFEDRKNI